MINHYAIQKALRVKLLALEVCTTGSVQLSATSTGYARASGSFLTDGFAPGMEIKGSGWATAANNAPKTIDVVTASTITCTGTTAEAASANILLVGAPADRAWENVEIQPTTGDPYVQEEYLPGPMEAITMGPSAQLEVLPTYVVKIYVPSNLGIGAARSYADGLLEHFAPRTALTVSGHTVVVNSVPAPYSGQLLQSVPGWATIPVTVPLRVRTANSI